MYGLYELNDNLFINAQAKYGKSYISKARQNMNLSRDISCAKTTGHLYSGKLALQYNHLTKHELKIVPNIGVIYDRLRIVKYQEKGTGFNRAVAARKVDKTTAAIGISLSKQLPLSIYSIIPEVHVNYATTLNARGDILE